MIAVSGGRQDARIAEKRCPSFIYVDTREKPRAIVKILAEFEKRDLVVVHQKLDVGDYMLHPEALATIDRKQNLNEVANNLTWEHDRFQRELRRAADKGVTVYVLVEHGGRVSSLAAVSQWRNPRCKNNPKAVDGPQLYKLMMVYAAKYGVRWRFCDKRNTGKEILRILLDNERRAEGKGPFEPEAVRPNGEVARPAQGRDVRTMLEV